MIYLQIGAVRELIEVASNTENVDIRGRRDVSGGVVERAKARGGDGGRAA